MTPVQVYEQTMTFGLERQISLGDDCLFASVCTQGEKALDYRESILLLSLEIVFRMPAI